MNILNEILTSNLSKTNKIIKLSALGYSINEIAGYVGSGYGFVWVVLKKRYPQGITNVGFTPTLFNRKFGVEIEAFGVDKNRLAAKLREAGIAVEIAGRANSTSGWKVTSDGSIRGEQGFEVVSPILEGMEGLAQLEKVCSILKQSNAKINKSCGLHIHFDAQNFKIKQWRNLYINYLQYETIIDSFMPASRRANKNFYCKGLTIGNRSKAAMIENIKGCANIREIKALYGSRYHKINCESFFKHGTVEFRQHSGTIEYSKIMNWVRFLHNLVSYSENHEVETASFEKMTDFNQNEIIAYLAERKEELN